MRTFKRACEGTGGEFAAGGAGSLPTGVVREVAVRVGCLLAWLLRCLVYGP